MMTTRLQLVVVCCAATLASGFVAHHPLPALRQAVPATPSGDLLAQQNFLLPSTTSAVVAQQRSMRAVAPTMGLFGLGTPELVVIAGVALLVLGPDQVKKLAKDVGKISAELKQVPEEFNKGVDIGTEELNKKKITGEAAPETPPTPPPTPPPAA
jgi:Sec-independent protein translocase protein TatA